MCSRKRLTFIKDFINNESVCHFMVVQLFKLSTKDIHCVVSFPQLQGTRPINVQIPELLYLGTTQPELVIC